MGLFKKRKPTIPKLPESPGMPEINSLKNRFSGNLPQVQNNQIKNPSYQKTIPKKMPQEIQNYNQQIPEQSFPELQMQGQPARQSYNYEEEPEEINSLPIKEPLNSEPLPAYSPEKRVLEEQIFVKVEKVKSVMETLNEINKKINYLDATLDKIKDIKNKEDEEISRWEKEILDLKTKIIEIDSKLFKN